MTISEKRDNTSRQAKACLRSRARIVDVYNRRKLAAKKKHKRGMSKDEFRERLTCDLQIKGSAEMTKQEIMAAIESLSQNERHEIIDHIFKFEEEQKPRFSLGMGQFAAWISPSFPEKWLVGISLQKATNATSAIMGEYLSQYGCIRQTRMDNTQDVTPLDIYIDFNRLIELTEFAEEQPEMFAERVRQKRESIWRTNNEQDK